MPTHNSRLAFASLGAALALVGCTAPIPRDARSEIKPVSQNTGVAATPDCRQLGAEISRTEQARRTALEKEKDAWKAVIPFAVAARYASGKSAVGQADKQLGQLHAEFTRQGCERHGG